MAHRDADPGVTDPREVETVAPGEVARALGSVREGDAIGEYRVVRLLGAGGMGEVYLARDEQLRRDVALKVVRPGVARERLLHEAQAMARLAHPNVVTVYEVGLVGEQVFIAMEYVAGTTLRGWLAEPRPWRDVVRHFVAAGRGLAAAHRAGLVHRDFKPDNVLVGDDDRARVGDFGLAAHEGGADGAIEGTPRYMAPEQHRGDAVDARTDQYAFCVSLQEASPSLPAWVRAIVQRGLSKDPDQRFPSMDALLDALLRDPAARWRRIAAGAVALGLGVAAVIGWSRSSSPPAPCAGDPHALDGAWDASLEAAMRARFHDDATADRVVASLDRYVTDWRRARKDACEATAVRKEQSPQTLDLRMQCLDRRRGQLGALTALLAHDADAAVVRGAVQAVAALPDLAACADTAALTGAAPPPAGASAAIALVRARLDAASARVKTGRIHDALADLAALAPDALAVPYPQLRAEVLIELGQVQQQSGKYADAETSLRDGVLAAAAARDDALAARGWRLLYISVASLGKRDQAGELRTAARAAVARAGDPPRLLADFLVLASKVEWYFDDPAAKPDAEQALALYERAGVEPMIRADALYALAQSLALTGELDAARQTATDALALMESALGTEHPFVAHVLIALSDIDGEAGAYAEQEKKLLRAMAIFQATVGDADPDVGRCANNLAVVYRYTKRFDEARAMGERSLANKLAALGPDHPSVGLALGNLAEIARDQGDLAAARDFAHRAVEQRRRTLGDADPLTAEAIALEKSLLGAAAPP